MNRQDKVHTLHRWICGIAMILAAGIGSRLWAQTAPAGAALMEPGVQELMETITPSQELLEALVTRDRYTIQVAVMGPGDALYFWWGHIGLIIKDAATDTAQFYDYGLFSFQNKHFFTNFAMGRLLYSCGVSPADQNIAEYVRTNRDVTIYTLDLPAAAKERIRRYAEDNVRAEHKDYYYHHFRDNCATRVRDLIDLGLEGQFKAAFENAPGRFTLRQHIRRYMWFSPFWDWLLNFFMGQDIDTPITMWEEMFLPAEIGRDIQQFRYTDSTGGEHSLVSAVEVVHRAEHRPPVLDAPPPNWPGELGLGIGIGVFLILLQIGAQRRGTMLGRLAVGSQRAFGVSQSVLGLFFGIAGSILFFMVFFTNHDYTYHNSNLLYINPLVLAIVPLGLQYGFGASGTQGKNGKKRVFLEHILRALWTYVFFGGILSLVIKYFPGFYQQNQPTQALVLPFAAVLSWLLLPLFRRHRP